MSPAMSPFDFNLPDLQAAFLRHGWVTPQSSFAFRQDFGVRKLEFLGYHMELFA